MASDIFFGSDYSTFRQDGTYGLTYRRITGARVPMERVARRWLTAPGDLPWDPTGGFDVAALENGDLKPADFARLAQILATEAKKVDFVIDAAVVARLPGEQLIIDGQILLADLSLHTLMLTASEAGVFFALPS